MEEFTINDKVEVIEGTHVGRTGTILRKCSVVFQDYVRVNFDLRSESASLKRL